MRRPVWLTAALLLVSPALTPAPRPAHAQTTTRAHLETSVRGAPQFAYERYRLDNGLEVVLHETHAAALAYVSVWYHAGSGDDLPGTSGLAHLCEHMMFEGSKHVRPSEHFRVLGATGNADANATTSEDRTNYFETVPAAQLETVLWLESDRMGYLRSLDPERFENQRAVVRNERRQSYENSAFGAEYFAIAETLYPAGHPYRGAIIGSHEELQAVTVADAIAFFQQWYRPANATLLIAGDIDVAATKAMVTRWFGTLPGTQEKPVHRTFPVPSLSAPQRQVVTDPFTKLRRLHYVWPTAMAGTNDDIALDVLADIMAGGPVSPLYWRLIVGERVANAVEAYQLSRALSGEFHLTVDLAPNASVDVVERLVDEEIAALQAGRIDQQQVRQVVAGFEVSMVTRYERLSARGEAMQSFNHYRGEPSWFGPKLATIRAATPASLAAVARQYLGRARLEVVTMPVASERP
jgi:zinc protease